MRLFTKILASACLLLAMTGCASFKGEFRNRLVCTATGNEALVVSKYGPVGIASEIDVEDGRVVCQSVNGY